MRKVIMILLVCLLALTIGCSTEKYEDVEKMVHRPINCATAEGDIRMLMHEKAHVQDQVAQGVMAFNPAGLVVGLASGTEDTKMSVASGDYNKMIDERIAEIKKHCGIK